MLPAQQRAFAPVFGFGDGRCLLLPLSEFQLSIHFPEGLL
jgi:hypothetical protein